jgi:hypothetical protein
MHKKVSRIDRFCGVLIFPLLCLACLNDKELKKDIKELWHTIKTGEIKLEL